MITYFSPHVYKLSLNKVPEKKSMPKYVHDTNIYNNKNAGNNLGMYQ